MKRFLSGFVAVVLTALLLAAPAGAAFGLDDFDVTFTKAPPVGSEPGTLGPIDPQAGSHPFAMTTSFKANFGDGPEGEVIKELRAAQVTGLAGIPDAVPPCSTLDFLNFAPGSGAVPECADGSAVGITTTEVSNGEGIAPFVSPVYNLVPAPGQAAKLGFWVQSIPVTIDVGVSESSPYNIVAAVRNISQVLEFFGTELTLWGNPADPAHDKERGACHLGASSCPAGIDEAPFLILPRACEGPLTTSWEAVSWQNPSILAKGSTLTHDEAIPPAPRGMSGCGMLDFNPELSTQPTNRSAEGPTGLDVELNIQDEGLTNPTGIANSDLKKAVVALPEGMTINPSQAEGLGVCAEAEFARERASSEFGAGCPGAAKIGTVEVESPLLENEILHGTVFVAEPYTNRFGSLIAIFMTIKSPELGIYVGVAGRVDPDPETGQLVTTFEDLPQLPFSRFHLRFREGARSPLVAPPRCGTYETEALFTPWANPTQPYATTASFAITSGVNGGPCPLGGVPPFKPRFDAGASNNNAGSFSPFNMRLQRADGEQDLTKFSSILPPGQLGSLAGVDKCPDMAVEGARSKTGHEELASPSCPANSQIGKTLAGAGVGESLTYVGGQLYLAGPYKGAPLSVIAITPAVAGPFDAGTVAVRLGLDLNPKTAQVEVDGAASDPIPHILQGIVLKLRDLRVNVDRPNFTLNPTSCDEESVRATLFGSSFDVFSPTDDVPVDLSTRYQAANCLNLGFEPRLKLNLKGGTKRGGHPSLLAVYRPRPGDANLEGLVIRLPRSAFLDQGNIRTICTRVQFAADACPKAAVYGHVKAFTPLLDEPLQGPVYLRSSNNDLPDLVFDLRGIVDIEVATRIDSKNGGIRATIENAPDAPITKVELSMQGGKKGLIVNSRNLCAKPARANLRYLAQNGRATTGKPLMQVRCGKGRNAPRATVKRSSMP